jgi:hypothetical protein
VFENDAILTTNYLRRLCLVTLKAEGPGALAAGSKRAQVRTRKFRSSDLKDSVPSELVFDTITDLPPVE